MAVSGEGGMLLTNKKELYERALLLANMGRTDSRAVFWSDEIGYEYIMSNLTASLALAQLRRVDELMQKKRDLFAAYYSRLKDVDGVQMITEKPYCRSNYCYPSILLPEVTREQRDAILLGLKQENIHARPAFPQMSRFPVFEQRFPNPIALRVEERGISLPSALDMTEEDVAFVSDTLIDLMRFVKKG